MLLVRHRKLFETPCATAEDVADLLGLTDLRILTPENVAVTQLDPNGELWRVDADACCGVRKVALAPAPWRRVSDTWISGRKRFQGDPRASLTKAEVVDGRLKLNPLAAWSKHDLEAYRPARPCPATPSRGRWFLSIGCFTCTDRVGRGNTRAPGAGGNWGNRVRHSLARGGGRSPTPDPLTPVAPRRHLAGVARAQSRSG